MPRDRLYLLNHEFEHADLPGRAFYCKDCITLDGLLAAFPDRASNLEVIRVAHPQPRAELVELLGESNQNLPSLLFAEGGFVNDIEGLLKALQTRHGFPERHP